MKKIWGYLATACMIVGGAAGINEVITDYADSASNSSTSKQTQQLAMTMSATAKKSTEDDTTDETNEARWTEVEETIQDLIASADGEIAVTYIDLQSDHEISINGDTEFLAASTSKVPLVMEMTDRINQGEFTTTQQIAYTAEDYEEGTGIIINDIQDSYSIATLMEYAICYSDNIATNMLARTLGDDFRAYYFEAYLNTAATTTDNYLTTDQAAEILDYLYTNQDTAGYETIIANMKETVFTTRLETASTSTNVAHKIGSYLNNIHDIGIFDAETPYILAVYTNETTEAEAFISALSDAVWSLHQTSIDS